MHAEVTARPKITDSYTSSVVHAAFPFGFHFGFPFGFPSDSPLFPIAVVNTFSYMQKFATSLA